MSIRVEALSKRYGRRTVLDSISFEVAAGSVTALIGPNGAGKSTLFKVMTNIVTGRGITTFNGKLWSQLANPRREVGAYLGASPFYGQITGRQHLALVAASCGASRARSSHLLEEFGLDPFATTKIAKMSLGARQRLGIATALIGDPPILLLDEPFSALDPMEADHVYTWLGSAADDGRTVIVSTHHLHGISPLATHALVMTSGTVRAFGSVHDLAQELPSRDRGDAAPSLPQIYAELI